MSDYPEHDKLTAAQVILSTSELSQQIGSFVDWLADNKGISLAHYCKFEDRSDPQLSTLGVPPIQELLAEFFDIDYDELMNEKERMLEEFRSRS